MLSLVLLVLQPKWHFPTVIEPKWNLPRETTENEKWIKWKTLYFNFSYICIWLKFLRHLLVHDGITCIKISWIIFVFSVSAYGIYILRLTNIYSWDNFTIIDWFEELYINTISTDFIAISCKLAAFNRKLSLYTSFSSRFRSICYKYNAHHRTRHQLHFVLLVWA